MIKLRKQFHPRISVALFALVLLLVPMVSWAMPILVPTSLSPGDTYHLVFVSSTTRDATSSDIADYDAFVQAAADAAGIGVGSAIGDIVWLAIASTSTVDAIDHTGVSGAVFRLDDVLVATGEADLFDADLAAAVEVTENLTLGFSGPPFFGRVWTGSDADGTAEDPLGTQFPQNGDMNDTDDEYLLNGTVFDASNLFPVYAISASLVVGGAPPTTPPGGSPVPEPSTIFLFGSGLVGLLAWRAKKGKE